MKRSLLVPCLALVALPACLDRNPTEQPSAAHQEALRDTARWELQAAHDELSKLNAVIAAVTDTQQRKTFESQAEQLAAQLDDVADRIKTYEHKAETELIAGILQGELADIRTRTTTLRAVVAGGDYE